MDNGSDRLYVPDSEPFHYESTWQKSLPMYLRNLLTQSPGVAHHRLAQGLGENLVEEEGSSHVDRSRTPRYRRSVIRLVVSLAALSGWFS